MLTSHFLPLVLNLLAFIAVLFFPLFLIPELLQRRGVEKWKARAVGWVAFPLTLLLVVGLAVGGFPITADNLVLWLLGGGGIAFAAWWDIRRARRNEARRAQAEGLPRT